MSIASIIPVVGQLLTLSLKLAEIIENSNEIDAMDKEFLKKLIKQAKDGVTYIDENDKDGS